MMNKFLASLLAAVLLSSVCLAADKPVSDDTIFDKVRISLASDMDVKGAGLKVDVKDGVVTLAGNLESQTQKDKATKVARKVKGVKRVVNNIEVKRHG